MAERPPRPPFDPLRGAWIILLVMTVGLIANSLSLQLGCIFGVQAMCEHTGENLREIALELITAVALLIAVRKRGNGGDS